MFFYAKTVKTKIHHYEELVNFSRRQLLPDKVKTVQDISKMSDIEALMIFVPLYKIENMSFDLSKNKGNSKLLTIIQIGIQIMNVKLCLRNFPEIEKVINPVFLLQSTNLVGGHHFLNGYLEFISQMLSNEMSEFIDNCESTFKMNPAHANDKIDFLGFKSSGNGKGLLLTNLSKLSASDFSFGATFWFILDELSILSYANYKKSNIDCNFFVFFAETFVVNYFFNNHISQKEKHFIQISFQLTRFLNKIINIKHKLFFLVGSDKKITIIVKIGFMRIIFSYDPLLKTVCLTITGAVVLDMKDTLKKESIIIN